MRFAIFFVLFLLSLPLRALTIDEVVRLHEAKIAEEVIVKWIETSTSEIALTVADIVQLKNKGVGDKVIMALLHKNVKQQKQQARPAARNKEKQKPRELSPFDQFFLSTYYSHQYGWPEPNYKNPQELLEAGLYYEGPTNYPHASRVRIYGWEYAYHPHRRWPYTLSPFSIIVPRQHVDKRYRLGLDCENEAEAPREEPDE